MIKMDYPEPLQGVKDRTGGEGEPHIRGEVRGFSRASRKRMIEFMARVRNQGDMYFVTMTYDDDSWFNSTRSHQGDFEAFRRRFERQFPTFSGLWRMEIKERLSGDYIGQKVPHFHLLIWSNRSDSDAWKEAFTESLQNWGVAAWGAILSSKHEAFGRYGFHVAPVRSRKHAYSYVSKYIGKMDDDDTQCGRRWGRVGKFDTGSSESIFLSEDETIVFRRLIKRWLRNRNRKFASRFAKGNSGQGYSVFGLGDTLGTGEVQLFGSGAEQFIYEAKRQVRERQERERGYRT